MHQCRWIEHFSDYDCEICYRPSKVNVVADALSRKERIKPKRIRSMNMTLQSSIKGEILAAQKKTSDESTGLQRGLDEMIERKRDRAFKLTNTEEGRRMIYELWRWTLPDYIYDVWKVIQNGNSKKRISTGKDGVIRILPPVSPAEIHAVEKERKARTILLHGLFHKEQLRRFQGMDDQKEILGSPSELVLVVIANVKKMQKLFSSYISFEHLQDPVLRVRKGNMNRFSQVTFSVGRTHGVQVSTKDANYKFSSGLCPQPGLIWQCYEELKTQMLILYPIDGGLASEEPGSKIDDLDIEEMDINWSDSNDELLRKKKFYKKLEGGFRVAGKTPVWFLTKKKLEFFNCTQHWHFARNGEHTEDEETNHALMAISSSSEKTLDSWKDSFKNLWRLINSGMSSNSKVGLGFEIQSNNEVLIGKPLYSRFIKTNDFKGVPHPLSGDYTPTPQEEIDESLYVYGKKGPQEPEPNVSDDRSSEYSTCQSNDSAGSIGTSSEHSVDPESEISSVPPEVYVSTPITTNEKGVSAPKSKEVEPSCVSHIKTPRQPIKDQETPKVNRKNWNAMMERELGEGYSFTKKKCFVCGSLSHLIKDCDYYEKKMAREAEFKKQRVFNTGNMVAKPVWTNTDRINHANQFVPRPVQLNTGRPNINSVRTNINTGRTNINSVRPRVNTVNSNVNTVRSRQPVPTRTSNSFSPKRPQDHLLKNMVDRGIFDSGYSGHMTGKKDQLKDFEEFNGGSITFGGSKCYISDKGKIRVGNLDFDCVSFVKEFGHFNLFSILQICDKQHKVLFTETECLVVSSDFKMPDENQILLKVPRHHNMYSFDMKTPAPAKGFACLIAKATSDESKLWHRRTLIEAARTMLADSLLPTTFWEEADIYPQFKKKRNLSELSTREKASSTDTSEDNPKILAFRRELEEIALKHLGKVSENTYTSTPSVNTGSESVNTTGFDPNDSPMPELEIFHKSKTGIFDEAYYDKEGVITDFNSLPTEIEVY
ncbi:hypothetical protein Tco_0190241 [Tanacetum coccineum]